MVELKGTEKQIAWAEDIRKEELEVLHKYQTVETGNREIATAWTGKDNKVTETEIQEVYSGEKFVEAKERLNTLVNLLENESDAKFIIDNREDLRRAIAEKNNIKCAINKFRRFFENDVVRINF
jgi:ketopantoate reductase